MTANHYRIFQNTDYTTDPIVNTLTGRQPARALKGLQLDQDQGTRNTLVNLDYNHQDFFGSRIHAQAYYRNFFTRFFPFDGRSFSSFGNSIIQSHIQSQRVGTRLEIETPIPIPVKHAPLVLWGLDFSHERTDQPVSIMDGTAFNNSGGLVFQKTGDRPWTPPIALCNVGLFAQFEWQALERILLGAGARHGRVGVQVNDFTTIASNSLAGGDKEFNKTVFNAGTVFFTMTKAVSLYGSYSQGFSIPDISRVLRNAGRHRLGDGRLPTTDGEQL